METCQCGRPLPVHLLGIMTSFECVCSCGRVYRDREGEFVLASDSPTPAIEVVHARMTGKEGSL